MKHAILITAYKQFDHLIDLVGFFDERFEFFIHIDNKIDVDNRLIDELTSLKQVKLVSRKYRVNWGGINHLKSILHLSEEALKHNDLYVFHLISGHDYPIKDCSYFIDFFEDNSSNYLSQFKMPLKQWTNGGMDRLEYYNLYDVLDAKKFRPLIFKLVKLQTKLGLKRQVSDRVPSLYGGETWWSLRRDALAYVVDYTRTQPYFLKRLKFSFCSEEIYFQTVIMNSRFAKHVVNDSLRYIDWTSRNGNLPANLDMSDWDSILECKALFARKFDIPISLELKETIKKHLIRS